MPGNRSRVGRARLRSGAAAFTNPVRRTRALRRRPENMNVSQDSHATRTATAARNPLSVPKQTAAASARTCLRARTR